MKSKLKIVLIGEGSPPETAGRSILSQEAVDLVGVFTNLERKDGFSALIQKHGLPAYSMKDLKKAEGIEKLRVLQPDWLVSANSTVILKPEVLEIPAQGAINVHPGLLPEFAGLHTHQWAIREGLTEFGVTIHFMTASVDAGDIIVVKRYPIDSEDTGLKVFSKALKSMSEAVAEVMDLIATGQQLPRIKQDASQRRLFRHKDALDGRIDWNWSAEQVRNFVRAGNYLPFSSPSYTAYLAGTGEDEEPVIIHKVEMMDDTTQAAPGSILDVDPAGLQVACGDGRVVCLTKAKRAGKMVDEKMWHEYANSLSDRKLFGRDD
ncbi:methionyl-tRNA formyltransferase [Calditrichota bacterium]